MPAAPNRLLDVPMAHGFGGRGKARADPGGRSAGAENGGHPGRRGQPAGCDDWLVGLFQGQLQQGECGDFVPAMAAALVPAADHHVDVVLKCAGQFGCIAYLHSDQGSGLMCQVGSGSGFPEADADEGRTVGQDLLQRVEVLRPAPRPSDPAPQGCPEKRQSPPHYRSIPWWHCHRCPTCQNRRPSETAAASAPPAAPAIEALKMGSLYPSICCSRSAGWILDRCVSGSSGMFLSL